MDAFVTVVGTHFRGQDAKQLVSELAIGDELFSFEREPENEYDANAIKVIANGLFIGYLARASNHNLAKALDDGAEFNAILIDFEGKKPVLHVQW